MMYDVIKKLRGQAFNAPLDVCLFNPMIVPQSDNHVFTVVQPDVMVFIDKNKVKERGGFGTPEFIIEILSPGNAKHELKTKKDLYEEYGVLEYLIVDPLRETIIQYVFNETKFSSSAIYLGNDKLQSHLFSELVFELKEIFPPKPIAFESRNPNEYRL